MRKFTQKLACLMMVMLCCVSLQVKAQSELTVADSTATNSNVPTYGLYADTQGARSQCIYPADLLTDMVGGTISQITFYLSTPASEAWTGTFQVSVGETDETSLANAFIDADLTAVYTGTMDATGTTLTVEFEDGYTYNGGNLVFDWLVTTAGNYKSAYYYGVALTAAGRYRQSASGTAYAQNFLPKATFEYTPGGGGPICDKPTSCDITDITANSATVNFAEGSGTYNVEIKGGAYADWTFAIKNTNLTSYALSDLAPNTSYQVRVQSVCGDNTSGYKSASFQTLIGIPYLEQFNSSSIPTGWSRYTGILNDDGSATLTSSTSAWSFGEGTSYGSLFGSSHAYGYCYSYSSSTYHKWLVSPAIPLEDNLQLTFNLGLTNSSGNAVTKGNQSGYQFVVLISYDGGNNWVELRRWNNDGTGDEVFDDISATGEEIEILLSEHNTGNAQFAFHLVSSASAASYNSAYIHIDDVKIAPQPTCLKPSNLHDVQGAATMSSIQVAWTANSGETAWRVQHKVSNDPTAEWITSDVSTNPYTINGLQPFTNYDVRVAAVCTQTDVTDYCKPIKAKTATGVPYEEKFDTTALPGEWKRYEVLKEQLDESAPMVSTVDGWDVGAANGVFPAANNHLLLNIAGADCNYWIVSPTIVMEDGYQLTFDLALTQAAGSSPVAVAPGEQNDDKFIVFISNDGGENWTELRKWGVGGYSYDDINPEGQLVTFDLSSYANQSILIALYGESTVANGNNNLHIANFKIAEIPACQQANSLVITDLEATSATAVWTSDDVEANWQYGLVADPAADFAPADEDFVNNTSAFAAELTGLSEKTNYAFFLRRACEGSNSEPLVKNFRTPAMPLALPWSENFDTLTSGIPEGWDNSEGTTSTDSYKWNKYTDSDNTCLRFNSYSNSTGRTNILATPRIYLSEDAILSFRWKNPAGGAGEVLISNDEGATRTALVSNLTGISDWKTYEIDLSAYSGSKVIIYFAATSNCGYGDAYLYLDDVAVAAAPDCLKPSGLAISGITATSATLVWNSETDGFPWVYAYAPASEPEPADDAFSDINVNSIELEGLEDCTSYKFYLRKNCGADAKSESISISFQTSQLPVDAGDSFAEDFEGEAKWLLNNGALPNAWVVGTAAHNGEGTHALYISNDGGATNAYTNTQYNVVFAQKAFNFAAGNYVFSYDWLANGEGSSTKYDYLRVALVPAEAVLTPGADLPTGVTASALPEGCIALDGGSAMNQVTSWQTFTSEEISIPAGTYNVVFMWRNDHSTGTNPPAAIDNFSFAKIACATPADFHAVDSLATTTSVVLKWTQMSEEDDFVIRYKVYGEEAFADSIFVLNDDSTTLTGLVPGTAYELQVAAWCDPDDATAIGKYSASIYALTKCAAVASINQNFDGALLCWSYIQETNSFGTYPGRVNAGDDALSAPNALYFLSENGSSAVDQYAILPELISLDNMRIKFSVRKEDDSDADTYAIVGVMTDKDDVSTFEALDSIEVDAIEYAEHIIEFGAYTGAGKYVAIKMPASAVGYASLIIDDVVVEEIPACVDPQGLHAIADEITSSSALLAWTPQGSEADWLVRYRISGAADWADTIHVNNDTLLLENLAGATIYEAQVAAWCDPTDDEALSPFSSSISFTTACGIISTFPYAENFDTHTATTNSRVLPICWSAINTSTYSSYNIYPTIYADGYSTYSNSAPNSLRFYSYYSSYSSYYDPQDQYAILPQMDGISGLRLKFNARKYSSYNSGDSIIVGIMTDPEDVSTFEAIRVIKPADANYEPFEVRFNNYAGEGQYIALKLEAANASNTSRGLYLDDIVVDELPSCFEPEGLAVFDIEENSAKFTWTVEEGESYVYAVALASAGEPAEDAFAAATDSMQISGLVDNKDYILYLRKNCAGNYSPSISAAFHTLMAPATAPYADDFEGGNNWMFINGSLTNAWAYGEADHNGEGTHAIYISNDGGASNAYNGSAPAVVYAVKSFDFEEGVYTFKYDWKANGEGTSTMYDYLRVFIVPESVELVPGTSLPTGLTATALPAAWNAIALDGGSAMNGVTSWQTFQTTEIAISAGRYKVVFLWRDDTSTANQTPAAIDNFSISKIACIPVSELAVSGITSSSATIAWTAPEEQDAWQLAYSADPNFDIAEATLIDVASTTYALADLLTDTLYNVYVRANCGSEDGVSVWSQISFRTAKSCQTPDDLAAADISINSATISWNTYGQTGFNLRYIQGIDTTLVPDVESPYELTGLQANTAYKVQVQAACESEDSWSAAINFKTVYGIPFEEKFASTSVPADWARYSGLLADVLDGGALTTTTSGWNFGTGNGVFNNHAKVNIFGTSCKYWLATPAVYVSDNVQLTFDLALTKFSGTLTPVEADAQADDKFAVLISTDNGANWSVLRLWDNAGSEYVYNNIACSATGEPIAIDLSAYDGQAIKIAFYGESTVSGNGDNNLHIDNVLIDLVPTCLKPTGFSISDVKAHSAQLNWTAGDESQSAWQIAIDTIAAFNPDTLSNLIDVTENPYVLAGLAPETRYYAYVRANCGATDGVSRWTDVQTFKTTIACPAPSALKAVLTPGDGSVATLSWKAGQDEAAWIVEYSLNSDLSDSIEVLAYDTFVNLSGLTAEATYYARVKADCGELDGKSLYSAIISFKPTDAYELLLNDGMATNQYVPVEGNYVDNASQRSQFLIPAAQLESLEWDSLTTLTFFGSFTSTTRTSWTGATFEAYVLEIEDAALSAEADWNVMTKVMNEASLALVDGKMVVSFSEPYQYQGGNLMIGIKSVLTGEYANVNWYGAAATGASFGGHGTSLTQRNFLPKMLINYVPGVAPACPNPKNLAVSGITDSEATFSWKAVEGATWEYALVQGAAEPASFISTEENSVTIADLAEATDYTFYLRRACGDDGYSNATLSVAFTTEIHVEAVPFGEDFEGNGSWKFVNGSEPNAWVIGNAAAKDGEKALYISNGNGNSYTKDAESYTYATILLEFAQAGEYTFAYDWKANGDFSIEDNELYDYLRVVLVPASATLEAGNPALPEGYIALDNGGLYGATDWQHYSSDAEIEAGRYKLVFAWFNDESDGEDAPAAVDNISIQEKGPETGLEGNAGIFNNGEAFKFLRDNKVFILVNGVIYDATGRKVEVVK